jgi:asparagine synthase (glutamine-hydrolysing)
MSVQYGSWSFANRNIAPNMFANVRASLVKYEFEGVSEYREGDIQVLYLPFCTTPESGLEKQPILSRSGRVVLWDGRLDNRQELIRSLGSELRGDATDVAIAAAALELWDIGALPRLIGDWALSVWNPRERTVLLAKDFLGARSLYYTIGENSLAWSTVIDPLFLSQSRSFKLQEEYLAGWFSHLPAAHLTPFAGIHSVPPCSYVLLTPSGATVTQYWSFDASKRISYQDDRDYEEHFRTLFGESVRRRLRCRVPVLAELSGGMDSSSIVCMADMLSAGGSYETPRLDTISYFDNSEPNWNEAPYFERVEQQRGRSGRHVEVDFRKHWNPTFEPNVFAATPDSGSRNADYVSHVRSGGYRVLLQGIGGDEVLGGVPTPLPELADLLSRGKAKHFLRQIVEWAIATKTPALHLVLDMVGQFFPVFLHRERDSMPTWLNGRFAKTHKTALSGYPRRFRVIGPLPSFQANIAALDTLRRQIACIGHTPGLPMERRYPYLDRELLEYLYAIPREQIVRPNQRRSLMRRALAGIVPAEILGRRRKAFIARAPLISIRTELPQLLERTKNMISSRARIVDAEAFRSSLIGAAEGGELQIVPALRTLLLEAWLSRLEPWTSYETNPPLSHAALGIEVTAFSHQASSADENPIERR